MRWKGLLLFLSAAPLQACPFCASNLSRDNQAFGLGLALSIFLLLGVLAALAGFIILQIIRQDSAPKP
ncbi:MAG TPA: hypothetical protein VMU88_01995 [bacterium]|nr:hypothetical protein [bacterium]